MILILCKIQFHLKRDQVFREKLQVTDKTLNKSVVKKSKAQEWKFEKHQYYSNHKRRDYNPSRSEDGKDSMFKKLAQASELSKSLIQRLDIDCGRY